MNNSTFTFIFSVILFFVGLTNCKKINLSKKWIQLSIIFFLSSVLLLTNSCGEKRRIAKATEEKSDTFRMPSPYPEKEDTNKSAVVVIKDYETIPVFFGTDRMRSGKKDINFFYGKNRNGLNDIEVGLLNVSIPIKHHRTGNIERPVWWEDVLGIPEDPKRHVTIRNLKIFSKVDFEKIIKSAKQDEAFLYVHGFNNTFQEASYRTAQLTYDLGFKGISLMFSWPSKGNLESYSADEDDIIYAMPHIFKFIRLVTKNNKIKKIHLIAHSMGSRGLMNVLQRIGKEKNVIFDQIILAAPDIDAEVFRDQILPDIVCQGREITIYASSKDKALFASKKIHDDNRLGQINKFTKSLKNTNVIDVSNLTSENFFNHDYIFTSRLMIEDLNKVFIGKMNIKDRNFERKSDKDGIWWAFKR